MKNTFGHIQKSVLLVLLEHGVAGVGSIALHANTNTASIFNALYRLLDEGLIAIAPRDMQGDNYRKGARQYGLTTAGINAAIELKESRV